MSLHLRSYLQLLHLIRYAEATLVSKHSVYLLLASETSSFSNSNFAFFQKLIYLMRLKQHTIVKHNNILYLFRFSTQLSVIFACCSHLIVLSPFLCSTYIWVIFFVISIYTTATLTQTRATDCDHKRNQYI